MRLATKDINPSKLSAELQTFPVGFAGWLAWLVRKAENKAKAQHSWGLGFAELGKTQAIRGSLFYLFKLEY